MLKNNNFIWSPVAEDAFDQLKKVMTQAPVLSLPDFSKQFMVECDASGCGVGVVLRQERPIAFFSHALQGKHLLLSTYEKEILALVLAVQKWLPYLGRQFVVLTDHHSLRHLWTQKITTTAQQRWLFTLMGYDFTVEYKRGKENIMADALSRRTESVGESGTFMAFSLPIPNWLESIRSENLSNPIIQELIQRVEEGEAMGPWKVQDGILYFKNRIYLDKDSDLVDLVIEQFHNSTHEGFHKTIQRVRSNFYFQGLRERIKKFIRSCDVCLHQKVEQILPSGLLQPLPIPTQI